MERERLILNLVDDKVANILRTFVNNTDKDFNLRELSRESKVPIATTYRILNKLNNLKLIGKIEINKFKVYKLNLNDETKQLLSLFKEKKQPLDEFVGKIKQLNEVVDIILHGDVEGNKANLVIIGDKINSAYVDSIVEELRSSHSFEISFVALDDAQYKKMTSMGLYSGKKKLLFSRT